MKTFLKDLRPALVSTLILAVVCCGLYPIAVTGISQLAFRDKANGSLITDKDGKKWVPNPDYEKATEVFEFHFAPCAVREP
jgi:hypothetical protein